MKTKKFNKRLALNKNTVANLNNGDMRSIYGGSDTTPTRCIVTMDITNCQTDCVCTETRRDC